jgi:hypothetical protein
MPIDRQIRYATGVQYKWSDRLSTGAQFVYADYGKAKIDNDLLKGDYKRNLQFQSFPKVEDFCMYYAIGQSADYGNCSTV